MFVFRNDYFLCKVFSFGYSIYSISLLKYWPGKLIFVLVIANALFLFKDLIEKYIPTLFNNDLGKKISQINNPKLSLIPTILVAAFAIYLHIHLDLDSSYVTYSLGFYSLWLGIICLVLYAVFHKKSDINIM